VLLTATAATTSRSFTYADSNWPEQPTKIHSASIVNTTEFRDEEFTYDALTGQVLLHRIIGWTGAPAVQETYSTLTVLYDGAEAAAFDPGGSFDPAWLSLPQPVGARKSVDGPRTDVTDVATFVYYPLNAVVPVRLRGKLAAMRNALGHTTRYETYDVFGSPKRVVDPTGVATETTYDGTGRLLTVTLKGVSGCDTAVDPLCGTDVTTTRMYGASNVRWHWSTARPAAQRGIPMTTEDAY
jgi:YD repeat-containing protein